MRSGSYDVVVIGDDLAAVTCAALCARRGLRTILLTHDDRPSRYALGPYKLPVDPTPWPLRSNAIERILRDLGLDLALRRKLRDGRLTAQVCGPDLRLDLVADAEALAGQLRRELASDGDAALACWDAATATSSAIDALLAAEPAFPATGFWDRKGQGRLAERVVTEAAAFARVLAERSLGPTARALLAAAPLAMLRDGEPSAAAHARTLAAWRAGLGSLRGDGDPLREAVLEKFSTAGGEVRAARAVGLEVSWGKVSAVRVDGGDELGAGQVVAALPPGALADLLGKKAPARLRELAEATRVVGHRYTLNLVVDEAALPEGMAPLVLAVTQAGWSYTISVGDPDDAGRVVVSLATTLPCDGPRTEAQLAAAAAERRTALRAELGEIMPFYERHVMMVHSPHQDAAPEVPGGRGGHEPPRGLPAPMRPVIHGRADDGADLAALPLVTGLKNLTLTGDQLLPQLGLEGELVAAWNACKQACMVAGRKKDFLRDEVVGT
ncbi:MAG: hypothetical protein KBG28_29445 [Kofleriaceae bacterium]|jgi:phytoene dehydrogenase-like protein|nr:hypothetical protein [Kofleriaceae bacterium]